MTVASGRSITLVASRRPPSPTSNSRTSAGCWANSSRAAAVVISNTVIGALALDERVQKVAVAGEPPLADSAESEALVEAHQMRRGIDMHAQPGGFQDR